MQTPSDSKTKIVPLDRHMSVVKIKPLPNGRIRISYHTAGTSVCLSDLTDQEALALQAAINDALIELDNEAYDDNVRR